MSPKSPCPSRRSVDQDGEQLTLGLSGGRQAELDRAQIDQADIRLAYVQHPVPAQGQTTDTAHLVVAEHATQEASYVALTRARQRTDVYAAIDEQGPENDQDRLVSLAEHMSRTKREIPSIDTPLAYDTELQTEHDLEGSDGHEQTTELEPKHDLGWEL